jgi:DNA-binding NtrC family response regulator
MPARVVVVHDDTDLVEELAALLRKDGHDVATFPDPLAAWDALEAAARTEVLVTRVEFPPGRSHGVALTSMARSNRPEIRVLLVASPKYQREAEDVGTFMSWPAQTEEVAEAVNRLLSSIPKREGT